MRNSALFSGLSVIKSSKMIFKLFFPLFLTGVISALCVVVIRPLIMYEGIFEDVSAWGGFFNVFGVIYAIIAGFLLVTVLTRFSALNQTLEDELNTLGSIRDLLMYFDSDPLDSKGNLLKALLTYAKFLASVEWDTMADSRAMVSSASSEAINEIFLCTGRIKADGNQDSDMLSILISHVSDLGKARTRRIALANEQLPFRLRLLLIFMSIILTASFLLIGVHSLLVHIVITSSLCISIYLLYWIIEDLDHPFYGVWNIRKYPLQELITQFEDSLNKKK